MTVKLLTELYMYQGQITSIKNWGKTDCLFSIVFFNGITDLADI